MAVVFISPKKRQKVFFIGITVGLCVFVIFVSLLVFLAQPKKPEQQLVFNKPKVSIDMSLLDSDQFKNLEEFVSMEIQYSYKAYLAKVSETKSGYISAVSVEEAQKALEAMGLTVVEIKEVGPGRNNPFTPYYDATIQATISE